MGTLKLLAEVEIVSPTLQSNLTTTDENEVVYTAHHPAGAHLWFCPREIHLCRMEDV